MKKFILILLICLVSFSLSAQKKLITDSLRKTLLPKPVTGIPSKPLPGQSVQAVKTYKTVSFWRKMTDSVKAQQGKIDKLNSQISSLTIEGSKLKSDLKSLQDSLDRVKSRNQLDAKSQTVTEIQEPSANNNNIVWGIIGVLTVALAVTLYQTLASKKEANYRVTLFDDLTKEFQTYKSKANEKEIKLARDLQTERNKVEELQNNR